MGYTEIEPIILDELHIALGEGPDGYRAQFKNITARGVSTLRVTGLRARLSDDEVQLQLALSIPKIRAAAKYRSSGTLLLVKASGAGDYWGEYGERLFLTCLFLTWWLFFLSKSFNLIVTNKTMEHWNGKKTYKEIECEVKIKLFSRIKYQC